MPRNAARIKASFVSQFGEAVLATRPKHGLGLLRWIAQLLALGVGAVVLVVFLRKTIHPRCVHGQEMNAPR